MGLRPGRCYSQPKKGVKGRGARHHRKIQKQKRSYTRIAIKVPKKNFIGAAPALRIRQFNMGNPEIPYEVLANLKVKTAFDLRDNAIESARMAINRHLVKKLGKDGFFMKVRVFPSNIMRENKAAQGAGADRVSQGMSQSFGKPIGRSARLRRGQIVYSVLCHKGQELIVKESLMRAKARFTSDVEVVFTDDVKTIGTLPSKKIKDVEIAKVETAEVATPEKTDTKTTAGKTDAKAPAGKDVKAEPKKEEKKK
jgi:large subunit ribosomal protein L10e